MQDNLSAYYQLNGTISASATSSWNSGAGFIPVGNSTHNFTGNFNGEGYAISGLFIDDTTDTAVGLLGVSTGTISNLGLTGGSVTGTSTYVGILAGWAKTGGTISNSYATGTVGGAPTILAAWWEKVMVRLAIPMQQVA